jgi:predicted nucleotidyltransferase
MADAAPGSAISLEDVRAHAEKIEAIGLGYGARNVRVFGSVARGEADETSDLDLLVDAEPGVGFFALSRFAQDVEDLIGVPTQVTTPAGLKQRIRARVLREAVPL